MLPPYVFGDAEQYQRCIFLDFIIGVERPCLRDEEALQKEMGVWRVDARKRERLLDGCGRMEGPVRIPSENRRYDER